MNKVLIGLIFILIGFCYGSLAIDKIYKYTLGYLVEHDWIKPPVPGENELPNVLGRKQTILVYAGILILIGLFIIWNRNR